LISTTSAFGSLPDRAGGSEVLYPPAVSTRPPLLLRAIGLLVLGVAILGGLVFAVGAQEVRTTLLAGDRRLLFAAFLCLTSQTLTMGLRWWAALRLLGFRVQFVDILRANCLSNLLNFAAPGHFGEPIVAAWLGRGGRAPPVEAFSVLIAVKAISTLLNGVILLLSLGFLLGGAPVGDLAALAAVVAVVLLAAVGLLFAVLHPSALRLGVRVGTALAGGVGRRLGRPEWETSAGPTLAGAAARVTATFALCRQRPVALVAATGLSLVKVASLLAMMALIFAAYGQPIGFVGAMFLETVDALANIVSIWIPGNLGVQEAILSGAASAGLATDGPTALSAAIASKALLTVHVAFGGLLFVGLAPLSSKPLAPSAATSGAASSAP